MSSVKIPKLEPILKEKLDGICSKFGVSTLSTEKVLQLLKDDNYPRSDNELSKVVQFYLDNHKSLVKKVKTPGEAESTPTKKARTLKSSTSTNNLDSFYSNASKSNEKRFPISTNTPSSSTSVSSYCVKQPQYSLSQLAGIEPLLERIKQLIFDPLMYHNIYQAIGIRPSCTILLHGPSGCGKTTLANGIAGELHTLFGVPFYRVSAPELIGSLSGESEQKIKAFFEEANASHTIVCNNSSSSNNSSCNNSIDIKNAAVLFVDNLDVIASKGSSSSSSSGRGMDKRILATLCECIDRYCKVNSASSNSTGLSSLNGILASSSIGNNGSQAFNTINFDINHANLDDTNNNENKTGLDHGISVDDMDFTSTTNNRSNGSQSMGSLIPQQHLFRQPKMLILIAATNKIEQLDSDIRGRFKDEIALPVPDSKARAKIAQYFCSNIKYDNTTVDFHVLGQKTTGYVGADLKTLVDQAGIKAVQRVICECGGDISLLTHYYHHLRQFSNIQFDKLVNYFVLQRQQSDALQHQNQSAQHQLQQQMEIECTTSTSVNSTSESCISYNGGIAISNSSNSNTSHIQQILEQRCNINMQDFDSAMKEIVPTAKREGFAVVPDVTFDDIGALEEVRKQLYFNIIFPIQYPEHYARYGLSDATSGILLYGPPGCGKTLLAKAIANVSGVNFISVKGPELLRSLVGESEHSVREVFNRARRSSPCVIFFDEIDALVPKRGGSGSGESGNNVTDRVVAQFLTELDGVEGRKDVYVIGATNRLDIIDDAIIRSKRFGTLLFVPLPTALERASILAALMQKSKVQLADNFNVEAIANDVRCEGFSGADLYNLLKEARLAALKEDLMVTINNSNNICNSVEFSSCSSTSSTSSNNSSCGNNLVSIKSSKMANNTLSYASNLFQQSLSLNDHSCSNECQHQQSIANSKATSANTNLDHSPTYAPPVVIAKLTKSHFEIAFKEAKASVPPNERKRYQRIKELLQQHQEHPLEAIKIANEEMLTIHSHAHIGRKEKQ